MFFVIFGSVLRNPKSVKKVKRRVKTVLQQDVEEAATNKSRKMHESRSDQNKNGALESRMKMLKDMLSQLKRSSVCSAPQPLPLLPPRLHHHLSATKETPMLTFFLDSLKGHFEASFLLRSGDSRCTDKHSDRHKHTHTRTSTHTRTHECCVGRWETDL